MIKYKQNWVKLVILVICFIFVFSTISQALTVTDKQKIDENKKDSILNILDDPVYEWIDNFDNEQKIESSMSYDYVINAGKVEIKDTYSIWADSSFTCMKPISMSNNVGQTLTNYAVKFNVDYDSDMKTDYSDVRFKHESYPTQYLPYWIESHDTQNAYIWVKFPSIPTGSSNCYMFYGNPAASSQSDFYDVFSEWEEEWANDEKISTHIYTEGAWDPDVAFGANKFLVVWEEGSFPYPPYTYFYKQDIRASLYNADGSVVRQDFTIRSGQDPQWHHENPSAAYGGGKFFVAWEHYFTSTDPHSKNIKARFVSSSGNVDSNEITVCDATDVQGDPMVKFDNVNNRFCVVWEDARSGTSNYDIYARLYDTNGNSIGGEKIICSQANNQFEPWVAFDPLNQQYFIVYEEKVGDFTISIYGQYFSKDLVPIGSRFKIAQGSSSERFIFPCVEFSEEAERFLVTYNGGTPSKPYRGNIYGKVYDTTGNLMASALIKSGSFVRTDIAPYLETAFLVCFNGGGKIWGRFILVDGSITVYDDDIQLSASTAATADWVNVAVDENEIFVTWEDTRVDYGAPFQDMPDTYGNIWHLNIGDSNQISYNIGDEKNIILEARVTSKLIEPENLFKWQEFDAVYNSNIRFDITDSNGNVVSGYSDIGPGKDLSSLNKDVIRLRATLTRNNPSYTPELDSWKVTYLGDDDEAPRTTIDHIDGVKGQNEWYIEESVTIWLKAIDFPEQTGSGIEATYYTINNGATQTYNPDSGIHLLATQPTWMGTWTVNFWSKDKAGNIEVHGDSEHKITIKIDAERPYIEIRQPENEQSVNTPFEVRAYAHDNAEIQKVEFNIEPFDRPNAPFDPDGYDSVNDEYYWSCDVGYRVKALARDIEPTSVSVMLRAQVYDQSGQTWIAEQWITVENWGNGGGDGGNTWWDFLKDLLDDIQDQNPQSKILFRNNVFRLIIERLINLRT